MTVDARAAILATALTPYETQDKILFKPPAQTDPMIIDMAAVNLDADGSFTITGGTSSAGVNYIDTVTVDGINILGERVDHTGDNTTTAAAVAALISEGYARGSFNVGTGTNNPGVNQITSITVSGVEILGAAVDHTGTASTTAAALAAQINAYAGTSGYRATSSNVTVYLTGPIDGGIKLAFTKTGTLGSSVLTSLRSMNEYRWFTATNSGAVINITGPIGCQTIAVTSAGDFTTSTLVNFVPDLATFKTTVAGLHSYTSGDVIYVPAGLVAAGLVDADFASGVTINEITASDDTLDDVWIESADYIFATMFNRYTDYVDPTIEIMVRLRTVVRPYLTIKGGKNQHWYGGFVTGNINASLASGEDRAQIKGINAKEWVWYDSIYIWPNGGTDTEQTYGLDTTEHGNNTEVIYLSDYYFTNIRAADVYSKQSDANYDTLHADLAQYYGKCRFLFIDGFTGRTSFQGFFLDPQHWCYDIFMRRINIGYTDPADSNNATAIYLHFTDKAINYANDIWPNVYLLDHVYAQERTNSASSFGTKACFPGTAALEIGTQDFQGVDEFTGEEYIDFDPRSHIYGKIRKGSPDHGGGFFGDYVVQGINCGDTLSETPSYETSFNAYVETTNCQLWLNWEHYYAVDGEQGDHLFGNEVTTKAYDISDKYNDFTCNNVLVSYDKRATRRVSTWQGNAYASKSGVDHYGTSYLFADAGEEHEFYAVIGRGSGTIISKGDQFRLHIENDTLYGVSRGATTTIMEGWDAFLDTMTEEIALVCVSWDSSNLVYYLNETEISGNVGTDTENGSDIELGRYDGASDYFSGVICDVRLYDAAFSATKQEQMREAYIQRWNIDGRYTLPTKPAAVANLAAVENGANLDITWDVSPDLGDSTAINYMRRRRETGDTNYAQASIAFSNTSGTPNTSLSLAISSFSIGVENEIAVSVETLGGYSDMEVITYTRTS